MNIIKLNNTEYQVESYNKNTYFGGESISSNASCSIITSDLDGLNTLAATPITQIQIYHDGTLIYNLQNIDAHIDSINEYLNDDRVNIGVNFGFGTPAQVTPTI